MIKEPIIPLKGMTDVHPMNIKQDQYPLMLNGNIQTDITSAVTLTNEHSNYRCNGFPQDYKVIGSTFSPDDNVTFYFLVNPTTGKSEIGYVSEYKLIDVNDQYVNNPCDECVKKKDEATPLEDRDQTELCAYTCIAKADCLNFNLDFPVRKCEIKRDNCGISLYFTDFFNPVRVLKLTPDLLVDDTQRTIISYTGDCVDSDETPVICDGPNEIDENCQCVNKITRDVVFNCRCCEPVYQERCTFTDLDCIKIRLFPVVEHICIEPVDGGISPGGSLKAGTYQLAACYSTSNGERATRTFSASNPVSIFDPNQTVTDQVDYVTDLAIKFLIKDLQPSKYSFIDIFVIGTINRITSFKRFTTIDITSLIQGTLEYTVSDFEKGEDVSIDDILQIFPVYEKAQEITSGGNTLILGNLTGPRDLNLQQAVIGISSFIAWESAEANEWFYADGINAAKYRSYLRDENYALGIVFERNNTLDTCAYPLIGRAINVIVDPNCQDGYVYKGYWMSTEIYVDKDIVTLGPNSYVHTAVVDITPTNPSTTPLSWTLITPANAASFCILPDTAAVPDSDDLFDFPGCAPKVGEDDTRWKVYNTGNNLGQPCFYKASTLQCIQATDVVICTSYEYTPTSVALSDITGTFLVGETVTYGVSSAIISFVNQGLGYLLLVTGSPAPADPAIGDTLLGATSGASGIVTSFLSGDPLPNDCYTDPDNTSMDCADNYPTPYTDITLEPVIKVFLKAPFVGTLVSGTFVAAPSGATGIIIDDTHQGGSDPYVTVQVDGTNPDLLVNDTITDSGANSAVVKKLEGCAQNTAPSPVGCNPGFVRSNNYANPPAWDTLITYNIGDLVTYSGIEYISLVSPNLGNNPVTGAPGNWAVSTIPSLCVDTQLLLYPSDISVPYAVRRDSEEVQVSQIITADYYIYPLPQNYSIPNPQDPTKSIQGTPISNCVPETFLGRSTGGTWLWKEITFPTGDYPNSLGANAMGIVPVATSDCVGFVSPQSLPNYPMYFLGEYLADPGNPCTYPNYDSGTVCDDTQSALVGVCDDVPPDSDNKSYCDCFNLPGETNPNKYWPLPSPFPAPPPPPGTVAFGDYWNIGPIVNIGGNEQNNTFYQSYWYFFTATTTLPTVVIQAKIKDAYNTLTPGDYRIDVYANSPGGVPVYSTGQDSNPLFAAHYYYNNAADQDQGVLICGDVAYTNGTWYNSVNAAVVNSPEVILPLTPGTNYYIHVYLLPSGIAKLDVAPIPNPNHNASFVDDAYQDCPCYLPNYAYGNICVNYPKTNETRQVTLPAINQLKCFYDVYYRKDEVIDSGCLFQTFEFGNFGFWQSATKKYPNDKVVWGDLCGQPVRHFKFPDVLISKVQDENPIVTAPNNGRTAKIYPMGILLDTETVKAWLEWAATPIASGGPGLITQEEKLSITGYKIVRANRVGNKSIVGKGLLYDMWKYNEHEWVTNTFSTIPSYYSSYPFNDLRTDPFLVKNGSDFLHPFGGASNNRFAFLSPETTFNGPTIGRELKFESVNWGDALGRFYTVKDHPKYVLLSNGGIALATTMAALQLAADVLILIGQLLGNYTVGLAFTIPVGSIVGLVGAIINLAPNFFKYASEWNQIITGFGVPKNFAMYYAAVGNYHSSGLSGEVPNSGQKRRLINNSIYLTAGNLSLNDNGTLIRINNYLREDSVYLGLDKNVVFANTELANRPDNSRFLMSSNFDNQPCSRGDRQTMVASYYASIKYNLPDQYGSIHDLEWLYTGECRSIEWNKVQDSICEPLFGGDTFICRMSQKRKYPFFLDTPVGVTTNVDWQYHHLSNITDAKYYFNSVGESSVNSGGIQFREVENNFDCKPRTPIYLDGSIYLFSYGITYFICESSFNLNFRHAEDTKFTDFYPHQSDIENWTQEFRVPIITPNAYLYNRDYSKQNKENFFCTQAAIYSNADCITTYRNRVINSLPDKDSDFFTDSWRIFLGEDKADFPLTNGELSGLDGIEREKVLVRFDDTALVFNAFYTIDTGQGTAQIGTGSMFAQKPEEYAKTELGYGGTQHHAFTSTQVGHFWVDAKRSAVFMLPPGAGLEEISRSYSSFFNNNLPFYILKDFPNYPVDNNYKDIGITLVWDNRFDRLILTKLDYQLLAKWRTHEQGAPYVFFNKDANPELELAANTIYLFTPGDPDTYTKIELTDTTYFCDKSWTIGYSPDTKSWISYYSFLPNYYVSHENYYQSGVNFVRPGADQIGVWNHLISPKSYQVFYGNLYPFITDVVTTDQLVNKQLLSLEYQSDFIRFQDDYDYFYNPGVTFNKMVIWSENQNSGNLELIPEISNDLSQSLLYPMVNTDSTSIMVTRKENSWRVNQMRDLVANKFNNVPPMILGCRPYLKLVNPDAINYNKPTFQRQQMTSDYFTLRFINDEFSNYKIINKWFLYQSIKSVT